jgi:NAD(P)-dependent dehydrogenase (short-subunit alcohol dehydrogenase family)
MNINPEGHVLRLPGGWKEMIKIGGGKIINLSSQGGAIGLPLRAAYCSGKDGVNQFVRTLAMTIPLLKVSRMARKIATSPTPRLSSSL